MEKPNLNTAPQEKSEMNTPEEVKQWDRLGALLSFACALHCLVSPLVTLSLPFWVYSVHYSPVHLILALFILPIGIYAFWNGYKRHHKKTIFALGLFGLALLMVALAGPSTRNQLRWNDVLTLSGSICLVIAHILNQRSLKNRS